MRYAVPWKISRPIRTRQISELGVAQQTPDLEFVAANGSTAAGSRCTLNEWPGIGATLSPERVPAKDRNPPTAADSRTIRDGPPSRPFPVIRLRHMSVRRVDRDRNTRL